MSLLHAGGGAVYWDYNATVERNLVLDWMQGGQFACFLFPSVLSVAVTPKLESLLANYSVLVYNGQLDGERSALKSVTSHFLPCQ